MVGKLIALRLRVVFAKAVFENCYATHYGQNCQFLYIIIYVMPSKSSPLYSSGKRQLEALGERLRLARLRRAFSAETVCARADISRPTLAKIEKGDASVTMGNYLQVLRVLAMEQDLTTIAADDVVGRRLQDAGLVRRERAPKRLKVAPLAPRRVAPKQARTAARRAVHK